MEMCLVFWNESSSGSFEQSWGVSNFLFCGGGCSMSSGVEIVFPNLVFEGKIEVDVGLCVFSYGGRRSWVVLFWVCGSSGGERCYFVFFAVCPLGFVNLCGRGVVSWSPFKRVGIRSKVSHGEFGF